MDSDDSPSSDGGSQLDGGPGGPGSEGTSRSETGGLYSVASQSERKKATHLRCERQRREAINAGYQELKDLLPASASTMGCKTTNAAILFRASDYITQLQKQKDDKETEIAQLRAQVEALRLISQQYESMAAEKLSASTDNLPQARILQTILDDCFVSFSRDVDVSDYGAITRTLVQWTEGLEGQIETSIQRALSQLASGCGSRG